MGAPTVLPRRGLIFILVSPSGAGKSTLSRLLLQEEPRMTMSVSVTTRKKRSNEVNGVHYHFIDAKRFTQMRERGELLEWAEVHGNFYGTPREPVEQALAEGRDILFDIDVQGTLELYKTMRADMVAVFILPPTISEQIARLRRRASDDDTAILKRLTTARKELTLWHEFDYVVVNDDLDRAYSEIRAILQAERLKRQGRQAGDVIAQLEADLDKVLAAGRLPK